MTILASLANLHCLIGMILCTPPSDVPDKIVLQELHAEQIPPASELIAELGNLDVKEREVLMMGWFRQGFWPPSQSRFKAIQVNRGRDRLVYWVMADYLKLGTDDDSLLAPLSWTSVRELAAEWKLLLPTAKMVNQIYQQSQRILFPRAYPPSDDMRSTEWFVNHNQWIRDRQGFDLHEFPLIAGHKKDLVVSKRLLKQPKKLALYGWHNIGNGTAIQPQSLWHGEYYVDYSHGIRFVWPKAELNGKEVSLADLLNNFLYADMISFEGDYDICAVLRYDCA